MGILRLFKRSIKSYVLCYKLPFENALPRGSSEHLLSSYCCRINCIHYAHSFQQHCQVRDGIPVAQIGSSEAEQCAKGHSAHECLSAGIQSQAFLT